MNLPRVRKSIAASFTALFLCSTLAAAAQEAPPSTRDRIEQVLHGIDRGHFIGQVAVSPDGKRLAWIQGASDGAEIRVAPLQSLTKYQRITAAASPARHCSEKDLAWSPDSAALAFFSDCADPDGQSGDQADLYLARPGSASPARRLTALNGYVDALSFSADGKSIAFLYVAGATRPAGALAAMKSPSGVIGEDGVEIQRIAVAQANAPQPVPPAFATPANLHVFEFDWSPDSKSLAYVAADPPGENNWWVAKLYTQPLGGEPKAILAPAEVPGPLHGLQIAVPRWSPDGKTIAFIGGLMSDQGATGGDVWIVSSTGGQPQNLTPNRPASPAWIEWESPRHLWATELAGGKVLLASFRLPSDAASSEGAATEDRPAFPLPGGVGDGRMELSLSATADRARFVFHASSFDHPAEIYMAEPATTNHGDYNLTQLSHINDGIQPAWGKTISLDWTSDPFHVQGWLMFPKDYDPAKKYPLLVQVHGGPASAVVARWAGGAGGFGAAEFSALGYFVLMPNPRGSFGQGEAFTQANRKDFGYGDLRDILAGVDTVLAKYPVDPNRVGIAGWSYGGFMSMFAVTQTNRFRAAVAGAGISNWQSYYGENSIGQWMIPYFGASVYDDPAVYAKSSAITFIKQARTPTLAVVGDRDGECPAPQSFEFWHALRDLQVPAQLVVYPNEGHGFSNPAHRRDVMERALDWFARYMPPTQ